MGEKLNSFTIDSYIESVENRNGLFRTLRIDRYEEDINGRPRVWCGNKSAVFRIECDGVRKMLKCYFKPSSRTRDILSHIASSNGSPYIRHEQWLTDEIYIYNFLGDGMYRDVALADWTEGRTLDYEIRKAAICGDKDRLSALAAQFKDMCVWLLKQDWAHGDLKPENILVGTDGQLTMIDYDAAYIPSLVVEQTEEIGTPGFQHPARDSRFYNKHIDDYPIALLVTLLYGLSLDPTLYDQRYCDDMCLLNPSEVILHKSKPFDAIRRLFVEHGMYWNIKIADGLITNTPNIDDLPTLLTPPKPDISDLPTLIEVNGKWGYANQHGQIVIPTVFDDAQEFSEGLAAVHIDNEWHYITQTGELYIRCENMTKVKPFSEGPAAVQTGSLWGYMNRTGNFVIEPQFNVAFSIRNGMATVEQNGLQMYLSSDGSVINSLRHT